MDYALEIKTTLIADNGKRFNIGSDISFTFFNKETNHHDKYIGKIKNILDDRIIIENVEINRDCFGGCMEIRLSDIKKNSCNYVSID